MWDGTEPVYKYIGITRQLQEPRAKRGHELVQAKKRGNPRQTHARLRIGGNKREGERPAHCKSHHHPEQVPPTSILAILLVSRICSSYLVAGCCVHLSTQQPAFYVSVDLPSIAPARLRRERAARLGRCSSFLVLALNSFRARASTSKGSEMPLMRFTRAASCGSPPRYRPLATPGWCHLQVQSGHQYCPRRHRLAHACYPPPPSRLAMVRSPPPPWHAAARRPGS